MTIVELTMQIAFLNPKAHIIIATPSNSAANLFTEALINSGKFNNPHDFIRFVANNQIERDLIPGHLQRYCGTICVASDQGQLDRTYFDDSNIRRDCTKSKIMNYRICIGTLSCFGSMMQVKFAKDHFSHVIIDEAGQATEPQTLIPMTFLSKFSGQIVLAGDPKQLGPMLISRFGRSLGLESSFLERLLDRNVCYGPVHGAKGNEYDPRFVTKLKINYRSVPSILQVYNELFYNSELQTVVNDESSNEAELLTILEDVLWNKETANKKCGVYFINVPKGRNRKVKDSSSWYNEEEMSAIMSFLSKLNSIGIPSIFKDVGVVS